MYDWFIWATYKFSFTRINIMSYKSFKDKATIKYFLINEKQSFLINQIQTVFLVYLVYSTKI